MSDKITYNSIAGQKSIRTEALNDGVFAVALTLLVLDIKVPSDIGVETEAELLVAFCKLTPKFLTYFLSFMTLGIFWVGNSTQYEYIDKSDRHLSWISLFFLLFVSLLPFTTAFLGEHIEFKLSIGLYWLNIFVLGVAVYVHWEYAYRHNFIALPDKEKRQVNQVMKRRILTAQALYAGAALLCFINTYLSIFAIIIIQLNYALALFSKINRKKS
jgi:uncharacterized membrane protein